MCRTADLRRTVNVSLTAGFYRMAENNRNARAAFIISRPVLFLSEFVYSIFHAVAANRKLWKQELGSPLTRYSIGFIGKAI